MRGKAPAFFVNSQAEQTNILFNTQKIMNFLTNDKLLIVGAGGMIGSNMVQTAMMLGLTPNVCLYDIYEPGVHGVADEMAHCAFPVQTSHGRPIPP